MKVKALPFVEVWLIGKDVKMANFTEVNKRSKTYEIPSDYVGVLFDKHDNKFTLHIGYKVKHKSARTKIFNLALKLDVKNIDIGSIERISDLREWDKMVANLNKILDN